jgi:uncharacterized damage-inducible protein DinB
MDAGEVLSDAFGRLPGLVRRAVDGLSPDRLRWAPTDDANTIGWLVWHLTRIQDHHVSELLDADQIWVGGGWPARFGLEPDAENTGFGHGAADVRAVRPEAARALVEYYEAVAPRTMDLLAGVTAEDLDRVVDRRWDPPVTMGVRLVSVLGDSLQHVGQAAYLRGLLPA